MFASELSTDFTDIDCCWSGNHSYMLSAWINYSQTVVEQHGPRWANAHTTIETNFDVIAKEIDMGPEKVLRDKEDNDFTKSLHLWLKRFLLRNCSRNLSWTSCKRWRLRKTDIWFTWSTIQDQWRHCERALYHTPVYTTCNCLPTIQRDRNGLQQHWDMPPLPWRDTTKWADIRFVDRKHKTTFKTTKESESNIVINDHPTKRNANMARKAGLKKTDMDIKLSIL